MSGAAGAGAAIAAAAAAKRRRLLQNEEEQLTVYKDNDMDGWEFKIVRASTRRFKTAEAVRKLCEEEKQAGWEMIEKFDDSRIRFKRRTDRRQNSQTGGIDPYRTQVGIDERGMVLIIVACIAIVAGIVAVVVGLQ